MKNSTKRRSVIGATLFMVAAMFSGNLKDTKNKPVRGRFSGHTMGGVGWNPQAIYSPPRGKHKGYMRDPQWRAKRKTK